MTINDPFGDSSVVRLIAPTDRATEHIVHFYGDETFFLQELTDYVLEAINADEAVVVIATPNHRRELNARLLARGVAMAEARSDGRFIEADAALTLAKFVVGGTIEPVAFADTAGGLIVGAMGFQGTRRVRAFGEMVALLCDDGRYATARELEDLWVALSRRLSFSLLCAYPAGLFRDERRADDLGDIARLHDRVVRSGYPQASGEPSAA